MNINRKNINKNILRIIFSLIILMLIFSTMAFAEGDYFTIEIPEGFYVVGESEGDIKLTVVRASDKLNFNVQVIKTEDYYDYTELGLQELVEMSEMDTLEAKVGKVDGEIIKIGEYDAYDISYPVTSRVNDESMFIRQVYIYEDTHTYTITIGGVNKKEVYGSDIRKALNSFKILDYNRENVKDFKELEEVEDVIEEPAKGHGSGNYFNKCLNAFLELKLVYQILISITPLVLIILIALISKNKKNKNKKTSQIN